jgi:hypothetical protein
VNISGKSILSHGLFVNPLCVLKGFMKVWYFRPRRELIEKKPNESMALMINMELSAF